MKNESFANDLFFLTYFQSSPMWTASSHRELEAVHPGERVGDRGWCAKWRGLVNQQGTTQLFSNSRGIQKSKHCIFQEEAAAWKTCTGNSAVIQTAWYVLTLVAAWPFGGQHQGLCFLLRSRSLSPCSNPMLLGHIGHHDQVIGGSDLAPWPQAHEGCGIVLLIVLPVCE